MTLLAAIEEIKDEITAIKTLLHADQFETNMLTDKFLNSEYPLMLLLPFTITDTIGPSGVRKGSADIVIYLVSRETSLTPDYSTSDAETQFIEPLRLMARRFLTRLNQHSVIDPESAGITQQTITPEYGLYDANTFGVSIRATVPIYERLTGLCLS